MIWQTMYKGFCISGGTESTECKINKYAKVFSSLRAAKCFITKKAVKEHDDKMKELLVPKG